MPLENGANRFSKFCLASGSIHRSGLNSLGLSQKRSSMCIKVIVMLTGVPTGMRQSPYDSVLSGIIQAIRIACPGLRRRVSLTVAVKYGSLSNVTRLKSSRDEMLAVASSVRSWISTCGLEKIYNRPSRRVFAVGLKLAPMMDDNSWVIRVNCFSLAESLELSISSTTVRGCSMSAVRDICVSISRAVLVTASYRKHIIISNKIFYTREAIIDNIPYSVEGKP